MKGKVAGLTISKGSGDPNAESTIRLRGVISLQGSNTPLVLIDGVEGGLGTVAPENIASIDVLKDASAAAIYGTRGANGVILITTKSGMKDSKTNVTYSGYASWENLAKKHKFMTAEQIRGVLPTSPTEVMKQTGSTLSQGQRSPTIMTCRSAEAVQRPLIQATSHIARLTV